MDIDTINTDDFKQSKKTLVSLSVAILSVWVLDVNIHQLSIWGLDIEQRGEGFLYILIFLVLLYVFGNFLIRQKTLTQRWRNEDLALGGIEHQFEKALSNIEGYGLVLDRLNLVQTNVDRIDCIRHVLEQLQSDSNTDLDKMNEFMTRTSILKIYDDYEEDNLEKFYEIVDELAKEIHLAKRDPESVT
jgi:hypothetical protein